MTQAEVTIVAAAAAAVGVSCVAALAAGLLQRRWRQLPPTNAQEPALRGSLVVVDLPTVLGLLGHSRATGALVVWSGDLCGVVTIRRGELVSVHRGVAGPSDGVDALGALLWLAAGSFTFEPGHVSDGPALGSVDAVLLRATTRADERDR